MIRLFSEPYESYTEEGNAISDRVRLLLTPVFEDAVRDGVSLRDLSFVVRSEVDVLVSLNILRRNYTQKQRELRTTALVNSFLGEQRMGEDV